MGLIFSFEKLSLVTSFWRGKGYLHTPPRFDSLLDLHSFPRPGYWMATHPRHPAWCCKWWGETRRSCCWARRCRRRICCCSGCRSLFPRAARIRWRTKLHSHTSELLYPLQVWFLGWWRTSFHLETQTKGIRVPKQINGIIECHHHWGSREVSMVVNKATRLPHSTPGQLGSEAPEWQSASY